MNRNKDWLQYSEELIEIVDLLIENEKFSWSCFTSHQASSAALKAVLSLIDESTFGDNLIALLRKLKGNFTIPEEVKKACHQMNDYFTKSRDLEGKPDGTPLGNFSNGDANQAKKNAMTIIRFAHHTSH